MAVPESMSDPVARLEQRARECDIDYSGRGHTLVEREWTGCKWRYLGDERLQGVALDVERFEHA
ncbi:hypothetical protein C440_05822 [Haloferax mucosum ATCC BAA-1512]|uniref:Uncharacterized protein n=1 Tax=Haloferax mucosum ATCC BAA-1512 TaxID=662479 RepID=M0IKW1_9EURY|nr:hypothetical protein [Haloferax mucosum]ELZ96084.1 hypothetical protein C440_05822 [Haloferax mucosum ATCC BAA-1512]